MSRDLNPAFIKYIQPWFSKEDILKFIFLLLCLSGFFFFNFLDKTIVNSFTMGATWFFGISFTLLAILTIFIALKKKDISYRTFELCWAIHMTNICIGIFAISYDYFYFAVDHPYTNSLSYIFITQGLFWIVLIAFTIFLSWIRFNYNSKARFRYTPQEIRKYALIGISLGVILAVILLKGSHYLSIKIASNLFNGSEDVIKSINWFYMSFFVQFAGMYSYHKFFYMKKYKEYICDEPVSLFKFYG